MNFQQTLCPPQFLATKMETNKQQDNFMLAAILQFGVAEMQQMSFQNVTMEFATIANSKRKKNWTSWWEEGPPEDVNHLQTARTSTKRLKIMTSIHPSSMIATRTATTNLPPCCQFLKNLNLGKTTKKTLQNREKQSSPNVFNASRN